MQSSSELFPVALVSAELRGDLSEDVYRLKPNNSPDSSVELALTRLGMTSAERRGQPVVLVHGSFSNRRFWYSPKAIGLGPYLAREGFDVWIAEMRGHGLSPRNDDYIHNNVTQYARYDLPAIAGFIEEQTGQLGHWLGHSLGGVVLAAALGGGYLPTAKLASVALFGSQVSHAHWSLRIPPVQWVMRAVLKRYGYVSGRRFKRGPEDEPAGVARETLRWLGLFGRFSEPGNDWWQGLSTIELPVLAVAAQNDPEDPAHGCRKLLAQFSQAKRHFLLLSKQGGFSTDFGHIEMLVSKAAQREVWPLVAYWLSHQTLPEGFAEQ